MCADLWSVVGGEHMGHGGVEEMTAKESDEMRGLNLIEVKVSVYTFYAFWAIGHLEVSTI